MLGYLRGDFMIFSERLKLLREERELTQSDLAKKLNISRQSVSNYEKGTRFPNDSQLIIKIAQFFHVSIDYLMGASNIRLSFANKNVEKITKVKEENSTYFSTRIDALEKHFYELDDLSIDDITKLTKCIKIFKDKR